MTYKHLSKSDQLIVDVIRANPGLSSPEIAERLGITMAATSSRLTHITNVGGLVERKVDPRRASRYIYYALPWMQAPAPEPVTAPTPTLESALAGITGMLADRILSSVSQDVVERLADSVVERVAARIGERMSQEVSSAVEQAMNDAVAQVEQRLAGLLARTPLESMRTDVKQSFTPVAPRKPRVMIIGLTDAQASDIGKEFGNEFDLRFVTSEATRNPATWRASVGGCQYVIAMTKFISHSAMDVVKKPILVNGGLTDLRNRLTELYVEIAK